MAELVWSPAASRHLDRLYKFLAPKNRTAAQRAIRAIRLGVATLAAHPQIGRPVEEMPAEFREWFIPFGGSGYVVLYRTDAETVVILAVRHAKEAGY
ncbi:MAG TPA: type II toxin-antitoxin system RelE/ParE family toxin [Stellaceae bacterium]|nr:type II toxin-antitoxin system RelE/ParE family toxin [Stellaceae bacterium]